MRTLMIILLAVGCAKEDDDTGSGLDDADRPAGMAPLSDLSSGECPDMSQSGTVSFTSSGEDRIVTLVLPDDPPDSMPLVFFFHGLLSPDQTPQPTEYMADALQLQSMANESGAMFVLPQSSVMSRMGFEFFMWTVDSVDSVDIVLFDDLRNCAVNEAGADISRVTAMGMSGGALFTTVVARDRGDTLASIIELSGGSDIEMLTFEEPLSAYDTPAYAMPAALVSGGSNDVWPGGSMTLVDFEAATDTLSTSLVDDGHFVVRCHHTQGHTVPYEALSLSWAWVEAHRFGEPSPFINSGIEEFGDWCSIAE